MDIKMFHSHAENVSTSYAECQVAEVEHGLAVHPLVQLLLEGILGLTLSLQKESS